jgi:hypothetical protein
MSYYFRKILVLCKQKRSAQNAAAANSTPSPVASTQPVQSPYAAFIALRLRSRMLAECVSAPTEI